MITAADFYSVMCAMVPLYFAMLIAYASVRWWKIFTPEQCSGVNRFVAAFAVPVLSFHFIASNDPYAMDARFVLADTVAKLLVLVVLSAWALISCGGRRCGGGDRLGWFITLFSLATLPNTLVMGIPLLRAMYGEFTQSIMVQLVVLQCIIWYTLLLILLEYRAATLLVRHHLPGAAAAAISAFSVDGDVISLDGRNPLIAESEPDPEAPGRLRVRVRRSAAPSSAGSAALTPRLSSLSGAEIYSANTPVQALPLPSITIADVALGGYASSDAYSLQPTPRASNCNETDVVMTPAWGRSPAARQGSPAVTVVWQGQGDRHVGGDKDLSFRSTSKLAAGFQDEEEFQAMPHPLLMLKLTLTVVGRKLSRNPNTYSSVLGLLWSLISFKWGINMPSLVLNSIKIISDAGLGMAMFSLGLFMALQPRIIACGTRMATVGMVIRFIGGPMIMSAASKAVGLKGVRLHTAIVQAALPQGIVPFVFAREYGLHPDILSTGVIFGMLVSLPVTLLYYIFLGL